MTAFPKIFTSSDLKALTQEVISAKMATSCESKRTKAYDDLRWRMVYQARVVGKTYREIGECLNVDASTVCRTVTLFDETGGLLNRSIHRIQEQGN